MTVHLFQLILSHLILTITLGGSYYYVHFTKWVTEFQGRWQACSPSYIWLSGGEGWTPDEKKKGLVLFLRLPLRGVEGSTKHLKMWLQEEATQLPLSRGTKRAIGAVIEGRGWWIGVPSFPGRRWGLSRGAPPASREPEACFCRWAGAAGDDLKAARALLFSEEIPDIFSTGTGPPVWGGQL